MASTQQNFNTTLHFMYRNENATIPTNLSTNPPSPPHLPYQNGCLTFAFSQMKFLPWHNPDNLISERGEGLIRKVKDILLVFLFLIGGPANVINMAVFYKQSLKDRVNLCLFVLSLVDGMYLFSQVVYHGEKIILEFTTGEKAGPVTEFLTNNKVIVLLCFCYISPGLSAIIALERCLCVFNPLGFQTLLRTRTMACIIVVMSVVVVGLYFLVVFRFHVVCLYDPIIGVSMMTAIEGDFYKAHKELIDYVDSIVFGAGLPGLVMVVVTTTTIMTIVKLRQIMRWRSETSSSSSSSISDREVALTKMLVGSSILFIVCVSPIALMRLAWLFFPEINPGRCHHNFFLTGIWISEGLSCVNATFNFAVYYVMGSRYRETFWALFGGRKKVQAAKSS